MMHSLDIGNVRELENLLIGCIGDSVLKGRLNQANACFFVHYAAVRDVADTDVNDMMAKIKSWYETNHWHLGNVDEN